jgi:hypothetical protein
MLTGAIYAPLFSNSEGLDLPTHLFAISCLAVASITALLARFKFNSRFNMFEISVFFAYMVSFIAYVNNHDDYVLLYTTVSAITMICCAIIVRSIPTRLVLNAAAAGYCLMIGSTFVVYYAEIARALDAHSANRWLIRIYPFGLHPDLVGFIFGGGAILLLCKAVETRRYSRAFFSIATILSILLVLAASARSSLLALSLALIVVAALLFRHMPKSARAILIWAAAAIILLGLVFAGPVVSYLNVILELDSTTRGLTSGGSGRTVVWSEAIDLITSSNMQLLIGGGLRWASIDNIGFSTEDSYVTIVLESGVIVGLALIIAIYNAIVRCDRFTIESIGTAEFGVGIASLSILLFAAIESLFNRYLFAIGNPLSLLLIFLYLSFSQLGRTAVRPGAG